MKKTNLQLFLALFFLLTHYSIHSQESISTSGGKAMGNGGTLTYTVGQLVYTNYKEISGSILQGVQYAYEFQSSLGLTSSNLEVTTVKSYPNPTSDFITIKISDSSLYNLSYILFDITGKYISRGNIKSDITQIKIHHLSTGVYLLQVNKKEQVLNKIKIIKK